MPRISITVFTDPTCPIALSAEPWRMRIAWLFRDQLEWAVRPIVLNEARHELPTEGEGFTKERFLGVLEELVDEHHMPIVIDAFRDRNYAPATWDTCRAIAAATVHGAPGDDWRLLQAMRESYWTDGVALNDDRFIDIVAAASGIDADDLMHWMDDASSEASLQDAFERARTPLPAARVVDYRLADAADGRRRYTCPTWELRATGRDALVVAGFAHIDAYENVLANMDPTLERRDDATSVVDVLAWAERPLALAELAAIRGTDVSAVQRELEDADIEAADWVRPTRRLASV